jgi:hypothetical protein
MDVHEVLGRPTVHIRMALDIRPSRIRGRTRNAGDRIDAYAHRKRASVHRDHGLTGADGPVESGTNRQPWLARPGQRNQRAMVFRVTDRVDPARTLQCLPEWAV